MLICINKIYDFIYYKKKNRENTIFFWTSETQLTP